MTVGHKVLLADPELSYLSTLEIMLLREYGEQISLELVTDAQYLDELFKTPQQIDILVINEHLWKDDYQRQGISNVFMLRESETRGRSEQGFINIYKFSSAQNVINIIDGVLRRMVGEKQHMDGRLVLVYSPQGGCGKTTLAIGAARALQTMGNRVLYVDAEYLQSFGSLLGSTAWADRALVAELAVGRFTKETLERNIIKGEIDYLAPMQYSLLGNSLEDLNYVALIRIMLESLDYDFIIVDTSNDFNKCKMELIELSSQMVIPFTQDGCGAAVMEALLRNINVTDEKKYLLVCNMFRPGENNALVDSRIWHMITHQIPYQADIQTKDDVQDMFMELAYSLI